ncbi:MAG TPA: hypothetical protein VMW24_00390 [Sedimentisphaerales bacterium]|nr:hypothetical protein [Sedimentisphaerales bacterium]
MSAKNVGKVATLALALVWVFADAAQADKARLLEKLNANVEIQLRDVTIAEALGEIGQKAGVKLALSDEAVWKLPYGEATRLSVTLEGPLADGMTEMLNPFFMRYAVGEDEITIYPRQELEHVIGRPSTQQLELLKKMYSLRISVSPGFPQEKLVSMLAEAYGAISFFPYDIPGRAHTILQSSAGDKGSLPVTLPILLEQVGSARNTPCWYLSGPDSLNPVPVIRLVTEHDFREAQLDQVVDISFKDERADVILQRLAGWAGMELTVNTRVPSWLDRRIVVNVQNTTLRQVLRSIVSTVDGEGISFDTSANRIEIYGPKQPRKEETAAAKTKSSEGTGDGYVGKISIPMDGGRYFLEFMLRESDLTEELRKLRDEAIKDVLGQSAREEKTTEHLGEPTKPASAP